VEEAGPRPTRQRADHDPDVLIDDHAKKKGLTVLPAKSYIADAR
jgi:hypothetical protein